MVAQKSNTLAQSQLDSLYEDRKEIAKYFYWDAMLVLTGVVYIVSLPAWIYSEGVLSFFAGVFLLLSVLALIFGTIRKAQLGLALWKRLS